MNEIEVGKYLFKVDRLRRKVNELSNEYEKLTDPSSEEVNKIIRFFNTNYGTGLGVEMFYILTTGDYNLADFDHVEDGFVYTIDMDEIEIYENPISLYVFKDNNLKICLCKGENHIIVISTNLSDQFIVKPLGEDLLAFGRVSDIDKATSAFYTYLLNWYNSEEYDENYDDDIGSVLEGLNDKYTIE